MTRPDVREWLDDLKHWFYQAEEVVDELATEALRSSLEDKLSADEPQSVVTKVRNFIFTFGSSSSFENRITHNMEDVIIQLENKLQESNGLGLRELSVANPASHTFQRVPTTCLPVDVTYGRDEDKEKIIDYLLSQKDDRIRVLVILGMGGLGKTTLAKFVYNDASVKKTFDPTVWVCVSDPFDVSRVTKSILDFISGKSYSPSLDLNFLQNELSAKLREKRFLLVLDDVWNENYEKWESLKAPFSVGAVGSKVIVTTRNEGVARVVRTRTAPVLRLKILSEEDGWSLFVRHAFDAGYSIANPKQEQIGRAMVKKCQGLPLAIKTLGGLLRFKQDTIEWEAILQSNLWKLDSDKSNVIPALWLSYFHLPAYLKRCFAYCAIYPKDYKMEGKKLVLLWMAEGLLVEEEGRRIEEVGNEYFRQLLSRSLFEPSDQSHATMHDLVHDLTQFVSGDFLATSELDKISDRSRHCSYVSSFYDGINKFDAIHDAKNLRTFLQVQSNWNCYLSNTVPALIIHQLSYLRVLSLSRYVNLVIPESIGCLKQLRYLDMSCTGIRQLPESVSTLYHLQTLLLSDCIRLERLPLELGRLHLLRHLDISRTKLLLQMPEHMHHLLNLQTLTAFVVGKDTGSCISELGKLLQISGQLVLRRLQNVTAPEYASEVNLSEKKSIEELALEFDNENNDDSERARAVLENLKPHNYLKSLTLRNYVGTRFPSWLDAGGQVYLKNITFLCLINCLYCQSLPPLGQLMSLKELVIEGMEYLIRVGPQFYGYSSSSSSPFAALESLSFCNMKHWEEWSMVDAGDSAVIFPRLQKLILRDCPKLKGNLPVDVPSLEELIIDECEELGGILTRVASMDRLEMGACPYVELASAVDLTSLTGLSLCKLVQVVKLPVQMDRLSSLENLKIADCENLCSLGDVRLPCKLKLLMIEQCSVLESLPVGLGCLHHFRQIVLSRCPHLRRNAGDSLPTSLTCLSVRDCEGWEIPIPMERMHHYTSLEVIVFIDMGSHFVSFVFSNPMLAQDTWKPDLSSTFTNLQLP